MIEKLVAKIFLIGLLLLISNFPFSLFLLTLVSLFFLLFYIDISGKRQYLHLKKDDYVEFYYYPLITFLIRILFLPEWMKYVIFIIPLSSETFAFIIRNYFHNKIPKSLITFTSFFLSALLMIIAGSFLQFISFPILLTILILSLVLSYGYQSVLNNDESAYFLTYVAALILVPIFYIIFKINLTAAIVLSGIFAMLYYFSHSLDEFHTLIFFFLGIFFYLILGWQYFLNFIILMTIAIYINFLTYEFKIEFLPGEKISLPQSSNVLKYQVFPFIISLLYLFAPYKELLFHFVILQGVILFLFLNHEFERIYAKKFYEIPFFNTTFNFKENAISIESIIFSGIITAIYLFFNAIYTELLSFSIIFYILGISVILIILEKFLFYKNLCSETKKYWIIPLSCVIITQVIQIIT